MGDAKYSEPYGTQKKISIIIPSYNSAVTIESCVRSVIQTGYTPLEIIIVDDVSTDSSPQLVEKLSSEYSGIVKLIKNEVNSGPAKGRNSGAKHAIGDYFFFLDSDTVMLPDALKNFIRRIEKCDAVTGIYHYESLNKGYVQEYKAMLNYYFFSRKGVVDYEVFDASRAGIKSEIFQELGGFNESLNWGLDYENEEFGYRLFTRYKNLLDPSVAVKHMFPGFIKLTKTYFLRVALWMEMFMIRKKFESGGVTSAGTGIASAALLLSIASSFAAFKFQVSGFYSLLLFSVYMYGYGGFWLFVLRKKPLFLPIAIFLNIHFTLVIAVGALFGLQRVITGSSHVKV